MTEGNNAAGIHAGNSLNNTSSAAGEVKELNLSQIPRDENGLHSDRVSMSNTSRTERNSMRKSPRIIKETDCGWSSKFFDNKNLYMSPNSHHHGGVKNGAAGQPVY